MSGRYFVIIVRHLDNVAWAVSATRLHSAVVETPESRNRKYVTAECEEKNSALSYSGVCGGCCGSNSRAKNLHHPSCPGRIIIECAALTFFELYSPPLAVSARYPAGAR